MFQSSLSFMIIAETFMTLLYVLNSYPKIHL